MNTENIPKEIADQYQDLFNLLSQEHDITATISQMDEIIIECAKYLRDRKVELEHKPSDKQYIQDFIDWRDKYFNYNPKTYEYATKTKKEEYTTKGLHRMYEKAYKGSPFKSKS